ncbi:MAG: hypothetical protein CL908_01400 [Deltaproteobacteria bacterium]|nr:hypothetical protein [Deltaproteobacteria bacterium]
MAGSIQSVCDDRCLPCVIFPVVQVWIEMTGMLWGSTFRSGCGVDSGAASQTAPLGTDSDARGHWICRARDSSPRPPESEASLVLRRDPQRRKSRSGSRPSARASARGDRRGDTDRFILYVEGARDREILKGWARRVDPELARCLERNAVILGGRQPARAVADFRKRGGAEAGLKGLIVLDRDHHEEDQTLGPILEAREEGSAAELSRDSESIEGGSSRLAGGEPGLEVFVWGLRHIESYLLVPSAIRRILRLDRKDQHVERLISEVISGSFSLRASQRAPDRLHAKRILGAGGSLSEALGTELHAGEIARSMRIDELHADIEALFDRIAELAGFTSRRPEVVVRPVLSKRGPGGA